jgi:uncharacterized membrane protein YsdA (DUF1294 family)
MSIIIISYLVIINVVANLIFGWDKHCARYNLRRVPERSLLTLAAVGGIIGVVAAQKVYQHKTQKEPFRTYLRWIGSVQIFILIAVCFL